MINTFDVINICFINDINKYVNSSSIIILVKLLFIYITMNIFNDVLINYYIFNNISVIKYINKFTMYILLHDNNFNQIYN